jgi:hypothetical protein
MSSFSSSTDRFWKRIDLYMPQNLHRFHGHPRVTRKSRLYASLGGLNGGISYTIIHDPFRKGKIALNHLNYNIFGDQDKGAASRVRDFRRRHGMPRIPPLAKGDSSLLRLYI